MFDVYLMITLYIFDVSWGREKLYLFIKEAE